MRRHLERLRWARHRQDLWALGALAALCVAGYARALGRYFVSEDFLILRQLASAPLWDTARAHFTGPLLGVTFVEFYRPVAAFLLHVELLLWGTRPAPYLLTHLGVHLLNAVLVYASSRRWSEGRRSVAAAVAAVFALYPLHPNTVVFVASFAALFGATFFLASLLLYEHARAGGGTRSLVASGACFALALGSYEQTVVLPVVLAARELLATGGAGGGWRRLAVSRWLPHLAVAALYFLVRQAYLGQTLGGYPGFRRRMLAGEIVELGRRIPRGFVHLFRPEYDHAVGAAAVTVVGLVLGLATVWAARRGGLESRLWLFGLLWILVTQAPFAFEGVVPGNGRYWYLASIGLGLWIAVAARLLGAAAAAAWPRLRAPVVAAALVAAVGLYYFVLLIHYAGVYREAGRTARTIQSQLVELASRGERVFVADVPKFVTGRRGTNLAQVFHWGLNDALRPPFVEDGPDVYPLPPLAGAGLLPVTERGDLGTAWRWDAAAGVFEPLVRPVPTDLGRIAVRRTGPGALRFRAAAGRHRLVVLAGGSAGVWEVPATAGGWVEAAVPEPLARSMRRLYGGEIFAWIERRRDGRLVAVSRMLRIAAGP